MAFGRTFNRSDGLLWLSMCLCLLWLATPAQCDPLPATTSTYYTIVTAGFDNLLYSMHYEEYGNTATQFTMSVGRYYNPNAVDWTDVRDNKYYLRMIDPVTNWQRCYTYFLTPTLNATRVLQGSTALLVQLTQHNVNFTNFGLTTSVRSQNSIHYSAVLAWTSSSVTTMTAPLDSFITQAFTLGGVDTSTAYSVSATVDVYFAADANGNVIQVGNGYVPLEYSIKGTRTDANGPKPLNIVYDFMHWLNLDTYTMQVIFNTPTWDCGAAVAGALPPVLPTFALGSVNATLPTWISGRVALELTASNQAAIQVDGLLRSQHGQELLTYVQDANNYVFYSVLYEYDFADERDFQFAAGAVYTLNGTEANPYNEWNYKYVPRFCTGTTITPNNVSPLQWINAGSLNTIFANPSYFRGAQSTGRQSIRAIQTDSFSIHKVVAYNGAVYDFTLQVYITASGWGQLGTITAPQAPQIVRLAYSGTRTPAKGTPTSYTMQMDFFLQYIETWSNYAITFNPLHYSCPIVESQPILPLMPAQYTVSVSETWWASGTSSQYTVYADTTRNIRRIDGRFTAPNTFSLITTSPLSSYYVTMVEWTQNTTVTGGFSSLSLSTNNVMPYAVYQPSQGSGSTCGSVTLSAYDFNDAATLNFFDWLNAADPSQAVYIETLNIRGVDLDVYQVSVQSENWGRFIVSTFQVYYLAADETQINTVPVMAEVSVQFYNYPYFLSPSIEYQFYNFRSTVPDGIFAAPTTSSCTGIPQVPIPVQTPQYITNPNPTTDGTNITSPVFPNAFSMLIEGQFFSFKGDLNIYVARWYVDFGHLRERIDIEPAFNISAANGVTPVQASYIFYYTNQSAMIQGANPVSFTNGLVVSYNGTCAINSITNANMNPLKQIPPGNLFDTFFPQTTKAWSNQSTYNSLPRRYWTRFDGFYYDEYDWYVNATYAGQYYSMKQSIFVSIPEWINNAQAANWSNTKIPLAIQVIGQISTVKGGVTNYNQLFRTTHYQAINPGPAIFDAALLGCATTPNSPWFNIYGNQNNVNPQTDNSFSDSAIVIGAVVGVVGGILFLLIVFVGARWVKRGSPLFQKYAGGTRGKSDGKSTDNELVDVGKIASDDNAPENSLNRASLNNLVKEGNPLEVEVEVPQGHTTTTSSDE